MRVALGFEELIAARRHAGLPGVRRRERAARVLADRGARARGRPDRPGRRASPMPAAPGARPPRRRGSSPSASAPGVRAAGGVTVLPAALVAAAIGAYNRRDLSELRRADDRGRRAAAAGVGAHRRRLPRPCRHRALARDLDESFASARIVPLELLDLGARVLALTEFLVEGHESGCRSARSSGSSANRRRPHRELGRLLQPRRAARGRRALIRPARGYTRARNRKTPGDRQQAGDDLQGQPDGRPARAPLRSCCPERRSRR